MVVAGIALGFVVTPALFALVAVGLADGVLAALFASGRIGPLASRDAAEPRGAGRAGPHVQPVRARGLKPAPTNENGATGAPSRPPPRR